MNQNELPSESALQGKGETVLVIEDDRPLLRLNVSMLVRANYRVLQAVDGTEALRVWRSHYTEIAAVVADLHLGPGRNGYSLLQEFSAGKANLVKIMFSGRLSPELIVTLQKSSRVQCLEKPASRAAFLEKLRTALDIEALQAASPPPMSGGYHPMFVSPPSKVAASPISVIPQRGRQRSGAHRPPPSSRNRGHQGGV